tara:strand:- start:64 stop:411 length:348 start_codon:yes stop_codon:yes gene_type:complete
MSGGWTTGKFIVKHYRRGDILDGEAFVLVPERDPAAIVALRAYASATPDPELCARLREWANQVTGERSSEPIVETIDKVPGWVLSLSQKVEEGNLSVEKALYQIAGYALLDLGSE